MAELVYTPLVDSIQDVASQSQQDSGTKFFSLRHHLSCLVNA